MNDFLTDLKNDFWDTIWTHFIIFLIFGIATTVGLVLFWFFWKYILLMLLVVLVIAAIGAAVFVGIIKVAYKWQDYKERDEE